METVGILVPNLWLVDKVIIADSPDVDPTYRAREMKRAYLYLEPSSRRPSGPPYSKLRAGTRTCSPS